MKWSYYHRELDGYDYQGYLNENSEKDIEELLIGRKIVEIKNDSFILDNGMVLQVKPNDGCGGCPSGNYWINHIAKVNNAITNVWLDVEYGEKDYTGLDTHYKIYVIADGIQTEILDVYGTDGNGYYGTGYEIDVYVPKPDEQ